MIVKKRVKAQGSDSGGKSPFWVKGLERRGTPMEEKALAIFQPDILIEPQFQSTYRRRFHLGPEHVLMLAVLQDAVTCYQEHMMATCKRKQSMHRDAEEWILSSDQSYLFSFENVCEALGYDADYLRQGLLRWRETALGIRSKKSPTRDRWPAKRTTNQTLEMFAGSQQK
jgi:hypothetical protein